MKKFVKDLRVESIDFLREDYILLRLFDPDQDLPPMQPGQFVQVAVENSPTTFPSSSNFLSTMLMLNVTASTYSYTW